MEYKTILTIAFLASRSLKLDPVLIGFDDFFLTENQFFLEKINNKNKFQKRVKKEPRRVVAVFIFF